VDLAKAVTSLYYWMCVGIETNVTTKPLATTAVKRNFDENGVLHTLVKFNAV